MEEVAEKTGQLLDSGGQLLMATSRDVTVLETSWELFAVFFDDGEDTDKEGSFLTEAVKLASEEISL